MATDSETIIAAPIYAYPCFFLLLYQNSHTLKTIHIEFTDHKCVPKSKRKKVITDMFIAEDHAMLM